MRITGGHRPQPLPSVPTGVAAAGASSSQINVSWNPSSDPLGRSIDYLIFRDGSTGPIGTASGTSFSDTGLASSSAHSYQVIARAQPSIVLLSPNPLLSAKSVVANATTLGAGGSVATNLQLINIGGPSNSDPNSLGMIWDVPVGTTACNVFRDGASTPTTTLTQPCIISGNIVGNQLNVTGISGGPVLCGMRLTGAAAGTKIKNQTGGAPGGTGTYNLNISQTTSGPFTCWSFLDTNATNAVVPTYDAPTTPHYYEVSAIVAGVEGARTTRYVCYEFEAGFPHCLAGAFASAFGNGVTDNSADASGHWRCQYPSGGGDLQPYAEKPMTPTYALEIGAFKKRIFRLSLSNFNQPFLISLHSRVPLPVGDVFSYHEFDIAPFVVNGPQQLNVIQDYEIPLINFGIGRTTAMGYISGSGSININGSPYATSILTITSPPTNGTIGVDIPGFDRGGQLTTGGGAPALNRGMFIVDMQGGFQGGGTGQGGAGTYTIPFHPPVGSAANPVLFICERYGNYKTDWHIHGGGSGVLIFIDDFGFLWVAA